ncbi:MAG: hypothetical protein ACJ72O_13315 [Marmoricola sp.]
MTHTALHPHARRSSLPRALRVAATSLLVFVLVTIQTSAHAASIDPWPSYQPQTVCSPTAKKGTLELAAYLQKHYPGSGSYGISRACGSGGRSEHKEGRAFDWRVNVNNSRERGYALNFIKRIRATDAAGHADALARRMGVMYVIFHDTIYSSSHNFAPRAYLNSGCRSKASCSATLRHLNHMHISLTRAGGQGRTSWYGNHALGSGTGSTPPTTTPTTPPDLNDEDSNIPTTSLSRPEVLEPNPGGTARTRLAVRKGQTVKVTAYGVNRFAPGHQLVSDATCVWNPETRRWAKNPAAAVRSRYGDPELRVNGVAVFASASCQGGQHIYSARIVQKTTSAVRVSLGGRDQHDGSIRVVLSRTTARIGPYIPRVPAASTPPAVQAPVAGNVLAVRDDVRLRSYDDVEYSDEVLEAGVAYQVTVTGTRRIARDFSTDGQCVSIDDRWEEQGSLDLYRPGATHGALYLDGVRFQGSAPADDLTGCLLHSHTMTYTPTESGRVALRIWDPTGTRDNDGSLDVRFDRITPVALPTSAPAETPRTTTDWTRSSEKFTVDADEAAGRISAFRLKAGASATISVVGHVKVSDARYADASCVSDAWNWVTDLGLASGQDLFEMTVDGQDIDWRARSGGDGCDSRHQYTTRYTASKSGPIRFAQADLDYGDNSGYYTVTITRG